MWAAGKRSSEKTLASPARRERWPARLRGKNPVAEGIQGSTARRGTDDSRCSEWWKGLSLEVERQSQERCQGLAAGCEILGCGEGDGGGFGRGGTPRKKVERGKEVWGQVPLRRLGVGG